MQAGLLKYVIDIQTVIIDKDEYGAETEQWQNVIQTKADVRYLNGSKTLQNGEIININQLQFIVRHYLTINEQMRIVYEEKKYRILSINNDRLMMKKTIIAELINE